MNLIVCDTTDLGTKKKVNQDAKFIGTIDTKLYRSAFGIVCDGVGSCECSEIASKISVAAFSDWFTKCFPDFADITDEDKFCSLLYDRWYALFDIVNSYVIDYTAVNKIKLGTTLSCLLVRGRYYYILHIGDTRVYSIGSEIKQLTSDHTLTARDLERGIISEEQARTDKRRHTLTKCVGMKHHMRPEFYTGYIEENTKLLICSDGFRDRINDEAIALSFKNEKPLRKGRLVKAAKKVIRNNREQGERDNITAVIIQVSED